MLNEQPKSCSHRISIRFVIQINFFNHFLLRLFAFAELLHMKAKVWNTLYIFGYQYNITQN